MGYGVGERVESAVACASFDVKRRVVGGEIDVTSNSVSLNETIVVVGRLASQIISRISFGSLVKSVKVDMMMVMIECLWWLFQGF